MVRMRCRIAEDEEPASALAKLRATLEEHVLDAGGARASSSRGSRTCSGSRSSSARDRQDLFAAWRLFFERLADVYPTVLVFEDMQWADASLLDFVEYLLEWSREPPALRGHARAAGAARAPADLGRRAAELHVALPRAALAAGDGGAARRARARACPTSCATRSSRAPRASRCTRSRRCGCCSTAACSCRTAPSYRPTGAIEALEVPETLHALIAARLDGLSAEERRLLQDGAGARQDVHASRRSPRSPGSPRPSSSRCSPRSSARRCSASRPTRARPSTASTASSRTSSATSPTRRSRSASARRGTSPPPRTSSTAFARARTRSSRCVASHYLAAYEAAPDADDAAEIKSKAREHARPRRRARRVARRRRARRSATSSRRRSSPTTVASERRCSSGRARWPCVPADPTRRAGSSRSRSRSTRPGRHARRRPRLGRLAEVERFTAGSTRRSRGWSAPSTSSRPTSRTRTSRCSRHGWRTRTVITGDLERGDRAGRAGARHRRGATATRGAGARARRESDRLRTAADTRRRPALFKQRSRSPSSTTSHEQAGSALLHPLRPLVPARPVRGRARTTSTTRSRSRGGCGNRPQRVVDPRRADVRPVHARALGRGARRHERADGGADALGRDVLSLLSRPARDPSPARRSRPRRSVCTRSSRGLEDSTDVQERVCYLGATRRTRTRRGSSRARRSRRRARASRQDSESRHLAPGHRSRASSRRLEAALALGRPREGRGAARCSSMRCRRGAGRRSSMHTRTASAARLATATQPSFDAAAERLP